MSKPGASTAMVADSVSSPLSRMSFGASSSGGNNKVPAAQAAAGAPAQAQPAPNFKASGLLPPPPLLGAAHRPAAVGQEVYMTPTTSPVGSALPAAASQHTFQQHPGAAQAQHPQQQQQRPNGSGQRQPPGPPGGYRLLDV